MTLTTLRDDGLAAALGLLVLLLAMSLLAIIRQPRWLPGTTEEDGSAESGHQDPAPLRDTPAVAAESSQPARPAAAAPAQVPQAGYPARHLRYSESASGPGIGAGVTGGPPWGPAPRPAARRRPQ